jgi:beta-hydroxylase
MPPSWRSRVFDRLAPPLARTTSRLIEARDPKAHTTFFDLADFPWVSEVERHWPAIRDEMAAVRDAGGIPGIEEVAPGLDILSDDRRWKTFFLFANDRPVLGNSERCPETVRALAAIPGMSTAYFSLLSPGKHIPAHDGVYKGLLRYHLGLQIPAAFERCRIRVGNDVRPWQAGQSLIFDDTFNHEVWNETDEERVILLVDFLRPLPRALDLMNRASVRALSSISWVELAHDRLPMDGHEGRS